MLTLKGLLIGVVCIFGANLIVAGLRDVIALPFSPGVQSMIASGIGAAVWIIVMNRGARTGP